MSMTIATLETCYEDSAMSFVVKGVSKKKEA